MLSANVRAERARLGLTQDELADKAMLSRQTISNIERGATVVIYSDILTRLADALGVTTDYLLGRGDD